MDIADIDDDFVDRMIIALAVQHYQKGKPSKKDIEGWFRYALAVQEARDKFIKAAESAYASSRDED